MRDRTESRFDRLRKLQRTAWDQYRYYSRLQRRTLRRQGPIDEWQQLRRDEERTPPATGPQAQE